MNCENCQELLSEFIDGELEAGRNTEVQAHIELCGECREIYDDFRSLFMLRPERMEEEIEVKEPNTQAMWCRIQNTIESELSSAKIKEPEMPKRWIDRIWNRSWRLTFSQSVSAVLFIGLISSLLTIIGIRNYSESNEFTNNAAMQPTLFERALGRLGVIETYREKRERKVKEQQAAIAYWNKRVEENRSKWDSHLKTAFDRNLKEIDQAVDEYTRILEENPQDDVSSEMLDSALNEKMELLRGFSEL